ncbi:MAG TPA: TonB-dependent receptor [Cytophagaceae bacterium]
MRFLIILMMALLCLHLNTYAQNQEQVYTQTVRGTVVDKNLQTPLAGVQVVILTTDPVKAVMTDDNGKFRIEQVPVGRHNIQFNFMGFKQFIMSDVLVGAGKEVVLNATMEEEIYMADEVVIKGEKDKSKANNSLITTSVTNLRTEEINRFAGSRQDPSRMAANYAGVAGGDDQRNDIIVRGNSPTGILWRLEGVDIPNPNHFTYTGTSGGVFSILNNNLLANSDFLTGAFPSEYGNKTAAAFDVRLRTGNNEKRENTFQIGLNGIELVTEGPIKKGSGASYLASYRFFSFSALDKLGVSIGANGIPQFHDVTFKIEVPTKKSGTFSLWGIGGTSTIRIKTPNEDTIGQGANPVKLYDDDFISEMFATGLSHTLRISEKTTGKLIVSASAGKVAVESYTVYADDSRIDDYDLSNTEGHYLATYVVTHKINTRNLIKAGVIGRNMFYNNYEKYYDDGDSVYYTSLDIKGDAYLWQAYTHWQRHLTDKLTINSGLYYQLFKLNNTQSLEPRFSASYRIADKKRVSLAAGLHSQTQPLFVYQTQFYDESLNRYRFPNKNLGFTKALHVVGGYEQNLSKNLRLKTELYYQHLYNVPVSVAKVEEFHKVYSIINTGAEYGFYALDSTVNEGLGRNYGAEITLERYFDKGYYFLTNLSLLESNYKAADGKWRSTAFNIGHVFNALAGKEFELNKDKGKVLSLDVKVTHSGGKRIIPIDRDASLVQNRAVYDYENAYSKKVKNYFRTDFKVTYRVNTPKANHQLFVAADNIFNSQNVFTQSWNNRTKQIENEYQLGIFPYLGYRVQF